MIEFLAEEVGKQWDEDSSDQGHASTGHKLLHALRLSSGVVVAIAFEQVDCSPNSETCAKCNNKGLENAHCALEKCHFRSSSPYSDLLAGSLINASVFCPSSRNWLLSDLLSSYISC